MGQQQLLLLILGVVIVALAVSAGIEAFAHNMEKETFDRLSKEAVGIAGDAIAWRAKPVPMGGNDPYYLTGLDFSELGYVPGEEDPRSSETPFFERFIRFENTPTPQIEVRSVERPDMRVLLDMHGDGTGCMVMRQQRSVGGEWQDSEAPPQPSSCGGWSPPRGGGGGGYIDPTGGGRP